MPEAEKFKTLFKRQDELLQEIKDILDEIKTIREQQAKENKEYDNRLNRVEAELKRLKEVEIEHTVNLAIQELSDTMTEQFNQLNHKLESSQVQRLEKELQEMKEDKQAAKKFWVDIASTLLKKVIPILIGVVILYFVVQAKDVMPILQP